VGTDAHIADPDPEAHNPPASEPDQATGVPETTEVEMPDLSTTLKVIESKKLGEIPAAMSAKVVRRIVDNEESKPRLKVAAFSSAS
jgi:hypothetical protein